MAAQIDPNYVPGEVETRQVYGVSLQQRRNDAKIDAKSFDNVVSKNKDASPFRPFSPRCINEPFLPRPSSLKLPSPT